MSVFIVLQPIKQDIIIMRRNLICLIALCGCLTLCPAAAAQETQPQNTQPQQPQPTTVYGTLSDDKTGAGIPYCTVSLRRQTDSLVLTGVVTDSLGSYRLTATTREACFLEFAHLAYRTASCVLPTGRSEFRCDLRLTLDENQIDAVTVLPQFVERKAGRYKVSLVNNPIAKNRFLNEVLTLLPGMREDQHIYKINGRTIVQIYIEDRPASVNELNALPAGSVKSVEIQRRTSSDQEFSERGAVLRVSLRALADGGYQGTVQTWFGLLDSQVNGSGASMPFSMRYGKFNLNNHLYYGWFKEVHEYDKRARYNDTAQSILSEEMQRNNKHDLSNLLNLVYEVNDRHRIGVTGGLFCRTGRPDLRSANRYFEDGSESAAGTSDYHSTGDEYRLTWQAAGSYRWKIDEEGSELTTWLDYIGHTLDKDYRYIRREAEAATGEESLERQRPRSNSLRGKVSLSKTFSEHFSLDAGGDFYRRRDNRHTLYTQADGSVESALFHYLGTGAALHAEAQFSVGRFDFIGGLRGQWDRVDHFTGGDSQWRRREYWRLCPNLYASVKLGKEENTTLELEYARDEGYIPYTDLSPLRIREDEFHYSVGNPALTPSHGYSVDATLTIRDRWTIAYNHVGRSDQIMTHTYIDSDNPQTVYTRPDNTGTYCSHSLSLSYTSQLTRWWRANWEIYGSWSKEQDPNFTQAATAKTLSLYLTNSFVLAKGLAMNLYFSYVPAYKSLDQRFGHHCVLSISISKYLCKNKLYIALSGNNLLYNASVNEWWTAGRTYHLFQRHRPHGGFSLQVAYLFNRYKGKRAMVRTETLQAVDGEAK